MLDKFISRVKSRENFRNNEQSSNLLDNLPGDANRVTSSTTPSTRSSGSTRRAPNEAPNFPRPNTPNLSQTVTASSSRLLRFNTRSLSRLNTSSRASLAEFVTQDVKAEIIDLISPRAPIAFPQSGHRRQISNDSLSRPTTPHSPYLPGGEEVTSSPNKSTRVELESELGDFLSKAGAGSRSYPKVQQPTNRVPLPATPRNKKRVSRITEVDEESSGSSGRRGIRQQQVDAMGKNKMFELEEEENNDSNFRQRIKKQVQSFSQRVRQSSFQEYDRFGQGERSGSRTPSDGGAFTQLSRQGTLSSNASRLSKWEEYRTAESEDPFGPSESRGEIGQQEYQKQLTRENTLATLEGNIRSDASLTPTVKDDLEEVGSIGSMSPGFFGKYGGAESPAKSVTRKATWPSTIVGDTNDELEAAGSIRTMSPGFLSNPASSVYSQDDEAAQSLSHQSSQLAMSVYYKDMQSEKQSENQPNTAVSLLKRREKPSLKISMPNLRDIQQEVQATVDEDLLPPKIFPPRTTSLRNLRTAASSTLVSPTTPSFRVTTPDNRVSDPLSEQSVEKLYERLQNVHPAYRKDIVAVMTEPIESIIKAMFDREEAAGRPFTFSNDQMRMFRKHQKDSCECDYCTHLIRQLNKQNQNDIAKASKIIYGDMLSLLACYRQWIRSGEGVLLHPAGVEKVITEELTSSYNEWFTKAWLDEWDCDNEGTQTPKVQTPKEKKASKGKETPKGQETPKEQEPVAAAPLPIPDLSVNEYCVAFATAYHDRAKEALVRAQEYGEIAEGSRGEVELNVQRNRRHNVARIQEMLDSQGITLELNPEPDSPIRSIFERREDTRQLRIRFRSELYEKKMREVRAAKSVAPEYLVRVFQTTVDYYTPSKRGTLLKHGGQAGQEAPLKHWTPTEGFLALEKEYVSDNMQEQWSKAVGGF